MAKTISYFFTMVMMMASEPVRVDVHDQVGLKPDELRMALAEAKLVMARAGVEVEWVASGGAYAIGIRQDAPAELSPLAMGFAMLGTGQGNTACAIYSRVVRLMEDVNGSRAPVPVVLGYVIAHELTHLLTRSKRHSPGVMGARWSLADLRAMSQRRLHFTAAQAEELRRWNR